MPDPILLESPFISEESLSRDTSVNSLTSTHRAPHSNIKIPEENAPTGSGSQSLCLTFDIVWKMMDASQTARGWCELPAEDIIWHLQGLKMWMDVILMGDLPYMGIIQGDRQGNHWWYYNALL